LNQHTLAYPTHSQCYSYLRNLEELAMKRFEKFRYRKRVEGTSDVTTVDGVRVWTSR